MFCKFSGERFTCLLTFYNVMLFTVPLLNFRNDCTNVKFSNDTFADVRVHKFNVHLHIEYQYNNLGSVTNVDTVLFIQLTWVFSAKILILYFESTGMAEL